MTEINSKSSSTSRESSILSTVQTYITSKRMIYLVVAIVLCVAIFFYMNRKKDVIVKEDKKIDRVQQEPEIIFSQELVQNLYRNNSNPIQYLMLLQQQGQIPNGPLPKIVLDYSVNNNEQQQPGLQQPGLQQPGLQQPGLQQPGLQQPGLQQPSLQQPGLQQPGLQQPGLQQPGLHKIDESGEESSLIDEINYENEVKTANSLNTNHYQKIEDDEADDDLINQKLTKAEIEKINKKILSK